MKFVLAPNAFKGSLTATEAAQAMARGIQPLPGAGDLGQGHGRRRRIPDQGNGAGGALFSGGAAGIEVMTP